MVSVAADISAQFMVGSSIMVVPNLEEMTKDATVMEIPAYLPAGCWYAYSNFF